MALLYKPISLSLFWSLLSRIQYGGRFWWCRLLQKWTRCYWSMGLRRTYNSSVLFILVVTFVCWPFFSEHYFLLFSSCQTLRKKILKTCWPSLFLIAVRLNIKKSKQSFISYFDWLCKLIFLRFSHLVCELSLSRFCSIFLCLEISLNTFKASFYNAHVWVLCLFSLLFSRFSKNRKFWSQVAEY